MQFVFDEEKNDLRLRFRGLTFNMVIEAIAQKGVLLSFDHPNQDKYPKQRVLVVDVNGYAYCVPYVIQGDIRNS